MLIEQELGDCFTKLHSYDMMLVLCEWNGTHTMTKLNAVIYDQLMVIELLVEILKYAQQHPSKLNCSFTLTGKVFFITRFNWNSLTQFMQYFFFSPPNLEPQGERKGIPLKDQMVLFCCSLLFFFSCSPCFGRKKINI